MSKKISELPSLVGAIPSGNSAPIVSGGTTYKFTLGTSAALNSGQLLDRANHTGTQEINTISGLESALSGVQVLGPYATLPTVQNGKMALRCAYSEWFGSSSYSEINNDYTIQVFLGDGTTLQTQHVPQWKVYLSGDETTIASSDSIVDALQELFTPHSATITLTPPNYKVSINPTPYGSAVGIQWKIVFGLDIFPLAVSNGPKSNATSALVFPTDGNNWVVAPAWDSATEYELGDYVIHAESIYKSQGNVNIGNLPTDLMSWTLEVSNIQYSVAVSGGQPLSVDIFNSCFNQNEAIGSEFASFSWVPTNHAPALFFGQDNEWKII